MPHRFAIFWHDAMVPGSLVAALGWMVGAMTADGIAAAITVVGVAVSVAMVRMAKPLADAIREVGFAWAEVKGRMRRELTATAIKAEDNAQAIEAMRAEVAHAKEEATSAAQKAKGEAEARYEAKLRAMREEFDREIEAVRREDEEREARRKVERQFQQNMILQLEDQVLIAHGLDPRVTRNEQDIRVIAEETHVALPPPEEGQA